MHVLCVFDTNLSQRVNEQRLEIMQFHWCDCMADVSRLAFLFQSIFN